MRTSKEFGNQDSDLGFTLIETLVGSVTLTILFAALVVFFQGITNMVGEARLRVGAIGLASEKIEVIRNMNYDDVGVVGGIPNGPIEAEELVDANGREYVVNTSIVYIDDDYDGLAPTDTVSADYKRVSVSVSWGGAFASRSPVSMATDIVPAGLEGNLSGGTLIVKVINSSGQPVSGADVKVKNIQVVPEIDLELISDSEGSVYLPGSPECLAACYELSASRGGYSTDRTYSTAEVTNPLKPHASVFDGDVTEITLAIDEVSDLAVYVSGSREFGYPQFQGVQFVLRGNKTIGTNAFDEPVYKYEQSHVSGVGGYVLIQDLEWDTYEIDIPDGSTVDFAGSIPITPFPLLPGTNGSVRFATKANTINSLLVKVTGISGGPIASASVTLILDEALVASSSAGLVGKPDEGQVMFSNLAENYYGVVVDQNGYKEASSAANVVGDAVEVVILEQE